MDPTDLYFIGEDKVCFPPRTKNSRELKSDQGQDLNLKGKKYLFYAISGFFPEIEKKESEFADFRWLDYNQAKQLVQKIYQPGKKRITLKALNLLKKNNLIN
jgi:hypothetical protein